MRLFLAITLPEDLRSRIAEIAGRLERDLPSGSYRWVQPDLLHLTLAFLGDVDETALEPLKEAAASACAQSEPFELSFRGLGALPGARRPRVLFVGAEPAEPVKALADRLSSACSRFGSAPPKPFSVPHVTIARARDPRRAEAAGPVLERYRGELAGNVAVTEAALLESTLGHGPLRYEPLASFPLGLDARNKRP